MKDPKTTFNIEVDFTDGKCPIGETTGIRNITEQKIPVLSCEGACIRGEIARLAANMIAHKESYGRACHGELFSVPQSAMARWVKESEKVIIIDGCFLKCHGRMVKNLLKAENIVNFDALSIYKKYNDIFNIDDVPEKEREEIARQVADTIFDALNNNTKCENTACSGCCN